MGGECILIPATESTTQDALSLYIKEDKEKCLKQHPFGEVARDFFNQATFLLQEFERS